MTQMSVGGANNHKDAREYVDKELTPTLTRGLTELCSVKPADPAFCSKEPLTLFSVYRVPTLAYCCYCSLTLTPA